MNLSPVWVLWCPMRWELWLKAFPHLSQAKGRSPVWIRWCRRRWELWRKGLWQNLHK